jgi:hypothetical protein
MADFMILSQYYFRGDTEENHKASESGWMVSEPRFELGIFRMP